MKKIMVICGTGVATSTIAVRRIKEWLVENHISNVEILQSRVIDQQNKLDDYDVVVSTTILKEQEKVLSGIPLLTGVGKDEFYAELKKRLGE